MNRSLVEAFEQGTLNLKEFDHQKHLYIAWFYLRTLPFQEGLDKYCRCLKALLDANGYTGKFSSSITEHYFKDLDAAMKASPDSSFEEVAEKIK